MSRYKLYFFFLLQLTVCSANKGDQKELVKIIGKDVDFTPVCSNNSISTIIFLACSIRLDRSRAVECHLLYRHPKGFEQGCDSRFSLVTINQTMFLQMNNLIQENNGNYACECAFNGGILTLNHSITVKENAAPTSHRETPLLTAVVGAPLLAVIIITGVILGGVCRNNSQRQPEPLTWTELHSRVVYEEVTVMETQKDLQHDKKDLYTSVKMCLQIYK
ncbi:hypothetical protein GOODEAATRI_024597 [Goodea atripinnis]|uniref:Immunoglobulin subtype domain-containing protein n=1 Tax=Goodea atripinnis TaxID=208336 RepID=A0ABV0ND97_9TELE